MKINATMIVLPVKNLDKTIQYYQKHFDFQVTEIYPKDVPYYVLLSNEYNHLGFLQSDGFNEDYNKETSINFDIDNIDEVYNYIRSDVNIIEELADADYNRKEFSLLDCNGYQITIGQYINQEQSDKKEK